jgi:hypothetical protein
MDNNPQVETYKEWYLDVFNMNNQIQTLEEQSEEESKSEIQKKLLQNLVSLMELIKRDEKELKTIKCTEEWRVFFPVGILEEELAKKINSSRKVILFSKETLSKQLKKHPDITLNQYSNLQYILDNAEVIKEGRNGYKRHLLFLIKEEYDEKSQWFKVAIKSTLEGDELYLLAYHPIQARELQVIREHGELLRESKLKKNKPFHLFSSYEIY